MLGHYIQLESLRFENKFDSVIHVDPDVDVESVEIPSMLIQPYVENAILHGLYNKKEKGLLSISVRESEGAVQVDIHDNGVGRKTSASLQQENMNKHKSMGTALTEERLRLINETGGATVEITDLESDGVAAGTLVRLWIRE
jgi:LytS/YehU family sensor histidine kinase